MRIASVFTILISVSLLFSTCKKDEDNCIQGNGDLKQSTRDVGEFNKVEANGAYNISFSQTSNTRLDLFGDSNVLPIIQTTSSNETVTITVQDGQCYSTQQNIEVTLTSPEYKAISLNGAGKIEGHNLIADELLFATNGSATINSSFELKHLVTQISGEGNANFVGTAVAVEFSIIGTGSILASNLISENCKIVISGAGDVRIHVNKILEVTISGSGNVYYTGDPDNIIQNITGTGQIIKEG